MTLTRILVVSVVAAWLGASGVHTQQPPAAQRPTLYLVSNSHLDTQWNWTVQDTIRQFVPSTFFDNFALDRSLPRLHVQLRGGDPLHVVQGVPPRGVDAAAEVRGRRPVASLGVLDQRGGHEHPLPRSPVPAGALRQAVLPAGVRPGPARHLPARLLRVRLRAAVDRRAVRASRLFDAEAVVGRSQADAVRRRPVEGAGWPGAGGLAASRRLRGRGEERHLERPQVDRRHGRASVGADDRLPVLRRRRPGGRAGCPVGRVGREGDRRTRRARCRSGTSRPTSSRAT